MTEYRDDIEEIEEDDERTFGEWLQDNLRIVISVVIVLLLALGIYSYSKRSQETQIATTNDATVAEDTAESTDNNSDDKGVIAQINEALKGTKNDKSSAQKAQESKAQDSAQTKDAAGSVATKDDADNKTTASTTRTSLKTARMAENDKEVSDAFVMVAHKGDGKTHLARRALAGYLAKNPVQGLTDAHKVYIEDYLQKAVGGPSTLAVGQQIRFSKDLIKQAIERSQKLTDAQLKNLQKFVR